MFDLLEQAKLSDLHIKSDPKTGLQAIIAIHNTKLGPALGGTRFIEYPNTNAAITDAIRLAKGMSYKATLAGLSHGGGKAVVIRPAQIINRAALFQSFGSFIEALNGRYITAMDSGTTVEDMDSISQKTRYVSSSSNIGDPSPETAIGVFEGIKACVRHRYQKDSLHGIHVAIQGAGHVGYALASHLHYAGATLSIADPDSSRVERCATDFQANIIPIDKIHSIECNIFSPCALGAIINDQTIKELKCDIVAGAANNQLADEAHGIALFNRDILYAPDFIINAGGLIFASLKYQNKSDKEVNQTVARIAKTLETLFLRSNEEKMALNLLANQLAEEQLFSR